MHRDPNIFGSDTGVYQTERWTDIRPGWNYLLFSGGARHCPAQQLALFWVSYRMTRIAIKFTELRNMDPMEELCGEYETEHGEYEWCKGGVGRSLIVKPTGASKAADRARRLECIVQLCVLFTDKSLFVAPLYAPRAPLRAPLTLA
ncbi:hypothetical protein EJ02DRAFT_217847, partial [Clathrospora elynae]